MRPAFLTAEQIATANHDSIPVLQDVLVGENGVTEVWVLAPPEEKAPPSRFLVSATVAVIASLCLWTAIFYMGHYVYLAMVQ